MSFGITDAGFVRKQLSDILTEMEADARGFFGNGVDLSADGEVGIFVQLMAARFAEAHEQAEDIYYSLFIDTAEGVQLDRSVALGGISRTPATKSSVSIRIYGDPTAPLVAGFQMQTAQGVKFESLVDAEINSSGYVDTDFRAIEAGPAGVVPPNSIVQIVTPAEGIASGTNMVASAGGFDIESDPALRTRYKERSTAGGSSVPAMRQRLLNVPNVTACTVYENATNFTDVDGRPPHSIEAVIQGTASDQEIADALFACKPAGIEPIGDESAVVIDANGDTHTMKWSMPTERDLNMIINVVSDPDVWIAGNIQLIKTRAIQVVGGVDTIGDTATEYAGLGVGMDVKTWRIIANFDDITGMEEVEVLIAFKPTTPVSSANLTISADEISKLATADITVNVS